MGWLGPTRMARKEVLSHPRLSKDAKVHPEPPESHLRGDWRCRSPVGPREAAREWQAPAEHLGHLPRPRRPEAWQLVPTTGAGETTAAA